MQDSNQNSKKRKASPSSTGRLGVARFGSEMVDMKDNGDREFHQSGASQPNGESVYYPCSEAVTNTPPPLNTDTIAP